MKHGTCPVCRKNLNGEDTSQREYISRPPNQPNSGDTASNEQTSGSGEASTSAASNAQNNSTWSQPSNNPVNDTTNSSRQNNQNSNNDVYDPDFD